MGEAPEKIYLVPEEISVGGDLCFDSSSWCQDRISPFDAEYIRKDKCEKLKKRVEELEISKELFKREFIRKIKIALCEGCIGINKFT